MNRSVKLSPTHLLVHLQTLLCAHTYTIYKQVRDKKQWRVNVGRVPDCPLSEYKPEVPIHELRRYGFQTMLIDLIDAPEPILRYFCRYGKLHQIPIAESLSPEQIERIKHDLPKLQLFFTMTTRVGNFLCT